MRCRVLGALTRGKVHSLGLTAREPGPYGRLPGEPEAIEAAKREFAEGKTYRLDDILRRVTPVEPLAPEEGIMEAVAQEIRARRRGTSRDR